MRRGRRCEAAGEPWPARPGLSSRTTPRAPRSCSSSPTPRRPAELDAVVRRAFGPPAHDPCGLASLEGPEPARITGAGAGPVTEIGLVAASAWPRPTGWTRLAAPTTAEEYARDLYAALRRADELELPVVVAVLPDASGGPLALAVRDRLARAAHEGTARPSAVGAVAVRARLAGRPVRTWRAAGKPRGRTCRRGRLRLLAASPFGSVRCRSPGGGQDWSARSPWGGRAS